jgi:uncharacterized repeat protein (TIGR03803 family)
VLYGSTQKGGTSTYNGTVFAVTPGGFEKVLHGFTGSPDGEQPDVALITVGGTLYGTTEYGGTANQGTVFSMKPSGKETVRSRIGRLFISTAPCMARQLTAAREAEERSLRSRSRAPKTRFSTISKAVPTEAGREQA